MVILLGPAMGELRDAMALKAPGGGAAPPAGSKQVTPRPALAPPPWPRPPSGWAHAQARAHERCVRRPRRSPSPLTPALIPHPSPLPFTPSLTPTPPLGLRTGGRAGRRAGGGGTAGGGQAGGGRARVARAVRGDPRAGRGGCGRGQRDLRGGGAHRYATQGSNPGLAGPTQVCYSHV